MSMEPLQVPENILAAVAQGTYHQPHQVLGAHASYDRITYRALVPFAHSVTVVTDDGVRYPLEHEYDGIWVATVAHDDPDNLPGYQLHIAFSPDEHDLFVLDDPYRHLPTISPEELKAISEGTLDELWTALGARVKHYPNDVNGTSFTVWAPNAQAVRVIGEFNHWDGRRHAMRSLGDSGVWELFVPGVGHGVRYKYQILTRDGRWIDKADPMARWAEEAPATASRVYESSYEFNDADWLAQRADKNPHNGPMSIYEVHAGSWRPSYGADGKPIPLSYRELADQLIEYVTWQGFTHVEFMPLAEHPFGGSWGYQISGYYAATSRYGTPDDLKYLIDRLHQAGIGVIMDWVPAHFVSDAWALAEFDGTALYEYGDPRQGEHPDWGSKVFNFGRTEVRNFLISNALFWFEEFHIDGLRVDAVASMLYLDYSRKDGEWTPNIYGGNHNLEAISLLQRTNELAYGRNPGIMMIAEESTAFDGVTAPVSGGGLGFGKKWNMGWMHDTLKYLSEDPVNRCWHHNTMTFSMVYAYSEKYILPLSHDEVVHGKGALVNKFPGDRWQQFATLRAYYAYMWAHPGKQLLFMGSEFAQTSEWSESDGLKWWLTDHEPHQAVMRTVKDLNEIYRNTPALWELDDDPAGFEWIDSQDATRNMFSFVRRDKSGKELVCIVNFSGTEHRDAIIKLPKPGVWKEVLNTDATIYGGGGAGNMGKVTAQSTQASTGGYRTQITIPALSAIYLQQD